MSETINLGVTVNPDEVVQEILPFCSRGIDGRDLLSLEEYQADVQREIGHQPGIARSQFANRQARQTSHICAGLAQFLARRYAPGVKDDADLDKIETALVAVLLVGPDQFQLDMATSYAQLSGELIKATRRITANEIKFAELKYGRKI